MKKIILTLISCIGFYLCLPQMALGAPAYPYPVEVKLPDGSYITLRVYGDEYYHYKTTIDGYMVEQGENGFYYYASESGFGMRTISKVRAHDPSQRTAQEMLTLSGASKAPQLSYRAQILRQSKMEKARKAFRTFSPFGNVKSLILLVQFQDVKFTASNPQQAFDALANQVGYADNGATGSVRDYYIDNSSGQFSPDFVVYGPVTVSKNMEYYGTNDSEGNDMYVDEMILEACSQAVKEGLNLQQFDTDNDGCLDNVFVYYAGYNEAELAPANTIWPHRSTLLGVMIPGTSLLVADYACTSELRGSYGSEMCGIGTFCHEFAHVLGLMDAYDTDGVNNGQAGGLLTMSLMSSGNYNNNGRTPPCINAAEREMLGWLQLETLLEDTQCTLPPLEDNKAYRIETPNEGEYFVLENRDMTSSRWDQYIAEEDKGNGLLIYHIDRSNNDVLGFPAAIRWEQNTLNTIASHPCFRFVPAQGSPDYTINTSGHAMFYPGNSNVVRSNFVPWSGDILPCRIENISLQGKVLSFDYYGTPIYAEKVEITPQEVTLGFLETKQLQAVITPVEVNDPSLLWESSDPMIAKVDEKGLVTGIGVGEAVITATSGDGKAFAECKVIVILDDMLLRELTVGQREIQMAWTENNQIKHWIIQWKKSKDQNFRMMESDTTFCIINMLDPDTEYDIRVVGKVDGEETGTLINKSFKTQNLDGEFATIHNIRQPFKEGDKYWPVVNNIQKDVRRITWKLDGKVFPYTHNLILPAGQHELRVEVTTSDGITEILIRRINVEPKKK
jgi:M6 family peptidase|nr:M6 family metalloprotease domain-containing protein [Odoribacter splanchnicus]